MTAGAAGMYCGSCLHDNALAAAMIKIGCDVTLIPLYTPIRTDEVDVSVDRVFFGGINVYLQEHFAPFRFLPRFMDRWLDWPWLIDRLSRRGIKIEANQLGSMTVSMLEGERGRQRKEIKRLVDWLAAGERPHIVNFTNVLIAGAAAPIKRRLGVPVMVTLQGDDLFLNELPEPHKSAAFREIAEIVAGVDGFIVNTEYYADHMSKLLKVERSKFHVVPLGLNVAGLTPDDTKAGTLRSADRPPTIGYLARIAPEKGLHLLIDAFAALKRQAGLENAKLRVAGWLGAADRPYFEAQTQRLASMGLKESFDYVGVVDRTGKRDFLRSLDVLSVPTTYREPKGLFVLESLAAGIPVVQPNHGAFPEMLASTGGGLLFEPNNVADLANGLRTVLSDRNVHAELSRAGLEGVLARRQAPHMAAQTAAVFARVLEEMTATSFRAKTG